MKKNEATKALILWAVEALERNLPGPSHEGACGPEAGCDGACMAAAAIGTNLAELRKLACDYGAPVFDSRYRSIAEIIEELDPSDTVLRRWMQKRGVFGGRDEDMRANAALHIADVYDYETIAAMVALEQSGREGFVQRVRGCARCGKEHPVLTFHKFTNKPGVYDYFSTCPETDEPILLVVRDDEDEDNETLEDVAREVLAIAVGGGHDPKREVLNYLETRMEQVGKSKLDFVGLNVGVWFGSQCSGMWYRNPKAAGGIGRVRVDGRIYTEEGISMMRDLKAGFYLVRKKFDDEDSFDFTLLESDADVAPLPGMEERVTWHSMEFREIMREVLNHQFPDEY